MKNTLACGTIALLVLALAIDRSFAQTAEQLYQKGIQLEEVKGELEKAIDVYKTLIDKHAPSKQVGAKALLHLGNCYEKLGNAEARTAYERLVRDYADQSEIVAQARVRLAALGGPGGAGGLVTRRILTDASGVGGVLTVDGKHIRSIDWGTGDVVQFEVASGQTSRITNRGPWSEGENWYEYQLFSRDGKQIAYTSYTKEKEWALQLRIRNLDGSGLRTLYSEEDAYVRLFDWSPDAGSILALLERKPNNWRDELTLISTADGSVRVLRSIDSAWYMLKRARFSPDGRFVAYSIVREGSPPQGDIFLMTADGRNEVVVAGHPAEDQLLGWTPDGTSLVFLSDRSGTWDIWTVRITEGKQQGEPELLKKNFGWDSEVLGFAPDGSLYYKTVNYLGRLYNAEVDLETGKVLVPPAPVTTRYTGLQMFLRWSPDGRNLAYLSSAGSIGPGNNILTIRSAATGEERFLSPRLRSVNQISWAPDGRSVIALGYTEKGTAIFRIDIETSGITKLAVADEGPLPYLCPDGKTLVFRKGGIIKKRNLDNGEESEVVKSEEGQYALSPDGREVVFQKDSTVKIVSLNGGEPRELFRGLAKYYTLKWTRDGRYIIVRAGRKIWRVPAQGGTPLKLDLSVPKMVDFALHPDNRRCAFYVYEGSKEELWVLENFLPPPKSLTLATPAPATPIPVQARPRSGGKLLMIVNEGESADLELALTKEVGVMKRLLEKAGFEVVVSTASNQPLVAGVAKLKPDLKLSDVRVADYKGFILPCMAVNAKPLPPEGYAIIKEAVAKGKPLAAQTGSVILLAKAGVLAGRKYAGRPGWIKKYPELKGAVYSGDGIVQDGRIITSGNCPYTAEQQGVPDGTSRLTEALIAELRR